MKQGSLCWGLEPWLTGNPASHGLPAPWDRFLAAHSMTPRGVLGHLASTSAHIPGHPHQSTRHGSAKTIWEMDSLVLAVQLKLHGTEFRCMSYLRIFGIAVSFLRANIYFH